MADDGGSSDSTDEDYYDVGDTTPSKVCGRPPFRKRVRRAKDIERNVFPESSEISQRQPRSVSSSSDRRDSDQFSVQERDIGGRVKKRRFSPEEDALLLQLQGEGGP
ncbi:hypothetical protein BJ875DRAFT_446996 [Amylocarpus encephaloides]|uniref:Uncharacterized protein n=1 Tax=Amylocarpus encephaloides TaxID=45428 RepID=A0A9P7Y6T8_9HELO|nr:hypothetical protein BJ875DRAFT_446996 [Amylocarpus encephaloides]